MEPNLLLGELKEFKRQTIYELREMRKEIKSLMYSKWKMAGISSVMAFIATVLVELFK